MKVLLVDNDDVSRVLMQHTLERSGFDVMSAGNGNSALELLLAHEGPCIALVDPSTHGTEGLEICREVRSSSNNPSVYMILLSSREGASIELLSDSVGEAPALIPHPIGEVAASYRHLRHFQFYTR